MIICYSLVDKLKTNIVPRVPVGRVYGNPRAAVINLRVVARYPQAKLSQMNAQSFSTNVAQTLTTTVPTKTCRDWLLRPGLLMAVSGIILISLSGWIALSGSIRTLFLVCGGTLGFFGIFLIPFW